METYPIKGTCGVCDGTGTRYLWDGTTDLEGNFVPPGESDCSHCIDGIVTIFTVEISQLDDILDKCNDIKEKVDEIKDVVDALVLPSGVFHSYQVFDVTDIPEWGVLSGNNKATFELIIHCGMVNLNDGSVKTALWAMFDSESTTRANLITLIG